MEPENIIKSIPEEDKEWDKSCGTIKLKFMRLNPSFIIIEKQVPISFFFESLSEIKREYKNNGILISMNENNLKIKDYFLFVKSLFKNQKIEILDEQRNSDKGSPDFKLIVDEKLEFYIEFKSKTDSVRPAQLQWIGDNQDKEVWFLILEEIETLLESEDLWYRQHRLDIQSDEAIKQFSANICNIVKDNLQNK